MRIKLEAQYSGSRTIADQRTTQIIDSSRLVGAQSEMKAMSANDRDDRGRFLPSNAGGPGRPPRVVEQEYLGVTQSKCTLEQWGTIVDRAVADATNGDAKARDWLSRYLLPQKSLDIDIDTNGNHVMEIRVVYEDESDGRLVNTPPPPQIDRRAI